MNTTKQNVFDINELQEMLFVFKRRMADLYRNETLTLHYSMSHLEILQYINEHKNPTMKDIASHLHITPPSVTTLIDAMVEHKLVKRENAADDRRTVRVALTPQARKLHLILQKKKTTLFAGLLKKLSIEQKQQLSGIIKTLIQ